MFLMLSWWYLLHSRNSRFSIIASNPDSRLHKVAPMVSAPVTVYLAHHDSNKQSNFLTTVGGTWRALSPNVPNPEQCQSDFTQPRPLHSKHSTGTPWDLKDRSVELWFWWFTDKKNYTPFLRYPLYFSFLLFPFVWMRTCPLGCENYMSMWKHTCLCGYTLVYMRIHPWLYADVPLCMRMRRCPCGWTLVQANKPLSMRMSVCLCGWAFV